MKAIKNFADKSKREHPNRPRDHEVVGLSACDLAGGRVSQVNHVGARREEVWAAVPVGGAGRAARARELPHVVTSMGARPSRRGLSFVQRINQQI